MATFEEEVIRSLRNGSDLPFGSATRILTGRELEQQILQKDVEFVASGGSSLRVFLGDYGTGKTLLGRSALELAINAGLLPIYISEPALHKPVDFYRAMINGIITPEFSGDSLFYLLSQWSEHTIQELEATGMQRGQDPVFLGKIRELVLEYEFTNDFNMAIAAFVEAYILGDEELKKKIVDWMSGRKVSFWELKHFKISRRVDNKEECYLFIKDILKLSRAISYTGIAMVFDELELMQNLQSRVSLRGYEALREILDRTSSKDFPNLLNVWLGTPEWFENPDHGVKSYLALYDRLKTEVSTTSESTVRVLDPVSPEIFPSLFAKIQELYQKAYQINLADSLNDRLLEAMKQRLSSPFHGEKFVEMRQVVKSLVEFFDLIKDGQKGEDAFNIVTGNGEKQTAQAAVDFWS
ncbi:MAG TPA: DUF2791 family P-loop domain-containing protein [Thermotogota bacterium]|nr:DUF2791 family P-loop domain-containing protein [Thermotogota bacterium]HRW92442.1 DUF2791 family P-loop domain-containing protein [Thermotogota bacterium]